MSNDSGESKAPIIINRETSIPIGWAVTIFIAVLGCAVKLMITLNTLETKTDAAVNAASRIEDRLQNDYVYQRELRTLLLRLQDLNPELKVPNY